MSLLVVNNLGKSFGGLAAVDDVSFSIRPGELLALIGPNGAGKTTTFNMINGQLAADRGSVSLSGQELLGRAPREIWRAGVGRTFQIAETFSSLTALENVQMALLSHQRRIFSFATPAREFAQARARALLEQVGMADQAERACSELSYGDIKRVELAMALANEPKLLLMDEPTAGMAPEERHALMALTKRLVVEQHIAVLFTEHSMDVVFAFADRVIVLARGRLIAEGSPAEVRASPLVQEVYFGSGATFVAPETSATSPSDQFIQEPKTSPKPQQPALLSAEGLCGWYGAAQILFDVDLEVRRGEVVALMGRNGAGKSTTIKALMGLLSKRTGRVRFMDRDISTLAPYQIASLGLGFVPEDRRVFTDLTVLENLAVGQQPVRSWPDASPAPAWTVERLFALFPNLAEMPQRLGGKMSGGEQQMLTVARTLMGNPFLVLLDEPSEGVAPIIVEQMVAMILALKQQGMSILLSEQNMHFAKLVCDRVYVLEKGHVRFSGTFGELDQQSRLKQEYLTM